MDESRDAHKGNWTECLERLAGYLPKLRVKSGL
jgi:hypothetical protein